MKKNTTHGGKREGAGAPKKNIEDKKITFSTSLPKWILNKLNEEEHSRAMVIEEALLKTYKWRK